jgi:hypothetical protein
MFPGIVGVIVVNRIIRAVQSANGNVLLIYDLIQKMEIGRFVLQSGRADDYRFRKDGTVEMG